jgi:type IV fimbrial biogenesis protein FimT
MGRIVGETMRFSFSRMAMARAHGLSMVELMTVLGIAMILLMIGIPSFSAVIKNQKITTTANEFLAAINLARSEAIRRGARVDLVPSDGADWAKGWIVFVDKNDNQIVDAGDEVISSHAAISGGLTIQSTLTDSSRIYLAYNGTGHTRTNASSQTPQFGTISFMLDKRTRRIKLNFVGRPRSCNPENDRTCTGSTDSD